MGINNKDQIQIDLLEIVKDIDEEIRNLSSRDPIFGFISTKFIKCGKKNCKCNFNTKNLHGPYYYLRIEPKYKYTNYLGKKIPQIIKERIEIGSSIKNLEKKRIKILETLSSLQTFT